MWSLSPLSSTARGYLIWYSECLFYYPKVTERTNGRVAENGRIEDCHTGSFTFWCHSVLDLSYSLTLCLVFSSRVVIFWAAMSHSTITHFDRVREKNSWNTLLVSHSNNYHTLCLGSFCLNVWHRPHLFISLYSFWFCVSAFCCHPLRLCPPRVFPQKPSSCIFRLDTTLIDFTDMKCQRGDLSFIFNGNAIPSESFVVLDNEQKVYQRIHHEVRESMLT